MTDLIILSSGHGTRYPDYTPVYPGKSSPDKEWLEGERTARWVDALATKSKVLKIPTGVFNIPLKQKSKYADALASSMGAKALGVAIHTNAAMRWGWKDKARGTVVWHHPRSKEGKRCAEIISENFKKHTYLPSRGIKTSRRLGMLRLPRMPFVIVEVGFHTSRPDINYMSSTEGQNHILYAFNQSFMDVLSYRAPHTVRL